MRAEIKLILAILAALAGVLAVGCGSESGSDRPAPVTDANGVETRANGTIIERQSNGDK